MRVQADRNRALRILRSRAAKIRPEFTYATGTPGWRWSPLRCSSESFCAPLPIPGPVLVPAVLSDGTLIWREFVGPDEVLSQDGTKCSAQSSDSPSRTSAEVKK